MTKSTVSIPKVVRLKDISNSLLKLANFCFNSKSGSIKSNTTLKNCIPVHFVSIPKVVRLKEYQRASEGVQMLVSIPKVVRLKATNQALNTDNSNSFQFQKWFD